jgi:tetratricopeptide (TPR) repeat protein
VILPDHVHLFCPQCGWDLKNDPTLVPSLDNIPDEFLEDYRQRVEIARRNWKKSQKATVVQKEMEEQIKVLQKKLSVIESKELKTKAQERLKREQKEKWLKKANDVDEPSNINEKIKFYTKAIELDPKDDAIYIKRGFLFLLLDKAERAIDDLSKAVELNSKNSEAYFLKGLAYYYMGDLDRAIASFSRHIEEVNPNNPHDFRSSLAGRGDAYVNKGDYSKAILDYTNAIELSSEIKHTERFLIALDRGNNSNMEILDISKVPNLGIKSSLYDKRGFAYYKKGNYDGAIRDYTTAIELKPKNGELYAKRAGSYFLMGEYYMAIADYTRAIELSPENRALIHKKRGFVYERINNFDRALTDLKKAIEMGEDDQFLYYMCGATCRRKGEYDRAIQDLTKAIKLNPKDFLAYIERAFAYDKIGESLLAKKDAYRAKMLKRELGVINYER